MRSPPALVAVLPLAAALAAASCGGSHDELTVYLPQRVGREGPPGQVVPVLAPVERERREHVPAARQAILDLRIGPSPDERARGVREALDPETRLLDVRVEGSTATVELAGREPSPLGTAAIVYSVTEATGAEVARLRLDGRPCCAYDHDDRPLARLMRRTYRGWSGEPCAERTWPGAVRCRID